MKWFVPFLATGLLTFGAEEPAAFPDVPKALDSLRTDLKASLGKIDEALTRAAKAGELKPSTEAYFRDCLTHFETSSAGLAEAERVYFPPRFDTRPEIEPINLAWADLRTEIARQQREEEKLLTEGMAALMESFRTAANTAERAAGFDPVQKNLGEWEKLENAVGQRRLVAIEPSAHQQAEAIRSLCKVMGSALEARAKGGLVLAAPLRELEAFRGSNYRFSAISAIQEDFRIRLLGPLNAGARDAQEKLENALIDRRPLVEIEAKATEFAAQVRQLQDLGGFDDRGNQQKYAEVERTYHAAIMALSAAANGQRTQLQPLNVFESLPLVHPARYYEFFLKLQREVLGGNGDPAAAPGSPSEAHGVVVKVRAEVRGKLAGLESAQATLALAEALPVLPLDRTSEDSGERNNLHRALEILAQQLRQLGAAWGEGAVRPMLNARTNENGEGAFNAELLAVRERALRDLLAAQQHTPELKEPPLAALPVLAALRQLANSAAEHGDWKKAFAWGELLGTSEAGRGETENSGQIQAIRAYLTGLNFEEAEQFPEAIAAYQQVLTQIADHIPLAESTERLKKLRAAHPELFTRTAVEPGRFPYRP